jgi:hypothetical protein
MSFAVALYVGMVYVQEIDCRCVGIGGGGGHLTTYSTYS